MGFIAPPTRRSAVDERPLSKVFRPGSHPRPLGEGTGEGVFISFDAVAARTHSRLSAKLAAEGTAVGPHDLIIAATALTKGYIVTTRDARSFPRIPGLSYQRW